MPLKPGTRLGPYEILALIGAGGMGEVWKARDSRLGRMVAIKVSSASFSERFEREARAVAALSHPNICTLYDIGPDYLVMEYIEGKPLQGPLPVETALRYAVEIARALDAAHRKGIVHRDLKPGNILVTKSGIKLLDFGIAKVTAKNPAPDETATFGLTVKGTILGTLQYMAPEQLAGGDADARSDIFAFGCVLYELLSGAPAFTGTNRADIVAAIVGREPKALPAVPSKLTATIQRCLAKDPDDRWQSARDLAGVLELAAGTPDAAAAAQTPKRALAALGTFALLACAAAFWFALRTPPSQFWSGQALGGAPLAIGPRVSPDGHTLAFQAMTEGQFQVAVMKPESGNWTVLTHQKDLGELLSIDWSRDGSRLYFDRHSDSPRGIFSVPVLGGEPRLVLDGAYFPCVLSDDSLVVTRFNAQRNQQLFHYWPDSGKIEPLPAGPVGLNLGALRATPDGKAILFYGSPMKENGANASDRSLYLLDVASRKLVNLTPGETINGFIAAAATQDGRSILYTREDNGFVSVILAPRRGSGPRRLLFTLTSTAWYLDVAPDGSIYIDQMAANNMLLRFAAHGGLVEQLTQPQSQIPGNSGGLALVLPDGRPLIYNVAGFQRRMQVVQPGGSLSSLIEGNGYYGLPAAMAGDRSVAVVTGRAPREIVTVSIADGRIVRRIPLKAETSSLASSPDGGTFYYSSGGIIWSMPATGGAPHKLAVGDGVSADPNGRDLLVSRQESDSVRLVRVRVMDGTEQPIIFRGGMRLADTELGAASIGPGGMVAVKAISTDRWMYQVGLIDPRAETIAPIPIGPNVEAGVPTWTRDGRIVASGTTYDMSIWRFRPTP